MTALSPISDIEMDIEMLFTQAIENSGDAGNKSRADSHMPTPPATPYTPPPIALVTSPQSSSRIPEAYADASSSELPLPDADDVVISISTSFHPSAGYCGSFPPDLVLLSADSVFFYVHSSVIGPATNNHLGEFLRDSDSDDPGHLQLIILPDQSSVLNVILHILYNISPEQHSPSFAAIAEAVDRCHDAYGIDVRSLMQGSALGISAVPAHITTLPPRQLHESLLFTLVSPHAALHPVEVYAIAASMDYSPLARVASKFLHGLDVCPPDDPTSPSTQLELSLVLADKIGGIYLSRLVGLHKRRLDALRAAVCVPPDAHAPVPMCRSDTQLALRRAWALVAAFIIFTAGPDFPAQSIDSSFRPLIEHLSCNLCKRTLEDRIKAAKKEWRSAPRTI